MSFLNPSFLFALFLLAIPLLIHLFNFRRYKRISFTNVSALRDIENNSRSVRRLKDVLVLIARSLGLAFLVFAFARPYLPTDESTVLTGDDQVLIFLDNSLSASSYQGHGISLENAKSIATSIVNTCPRDMNFHILTNGFEQAELDPCNWDDAMKEIGKVEISSKSRSFDAILNRAKELSGKAKGRTHLYLISDFQRFQFNSIPGEPDSNIHLHLVYLPWDYKENLSIDTAWLSNPSPVLDGKDSLLLRLSNRGSENVQGEVLRMFVNDMQVWMKPVDIGAGNEEVLSIPLEQGNFGNFFCRLNIGEDQLDFDNELYLSYSIDSAPSVYYIGEEKLGRRMRALFRSPFRYSQDRISTIDISKLNSSNLIILSVRENISDGLVKALDQNLRSGASLVLLPDDSAGMEVMNSLLHGLSLGSMTGMDTSRTSVKSINEHSELIKSALRRIPDNPNLPWVREHFNYSAPGRKAYEDILDFEDGPALRKLSLESGNAFVFCFDIGNSNSNLMDHTLFVPIMLNAAFKGKNRADAYRDLSNIGLVELENPPGSDDVYHLKGEGLDLIPEVKRLPRGLALAFDQQVDEPGNYSIYLGDELVRPISFDHNRKESLPDVIGPDEMLEKTGQRNWKNVNIYKGKTAEITREIRQSSQPISLWKYCVILALVFFAAELIILKFVRA